MIAPVIDLGAVREKRADDRRQCGIALDEIAKIARDFASLAFSVSGPIWLVNQRFAMDINRSQWRRMRVTMRRLTRRAHPKVKAMVLQWADDVFQDQLWKLADARDGKRDRV